MMKIPQICNQDKSKYHLRLNLYGPKKTQAIMHIWKVSLKLVFGLCQKKPTDMQRCGTGKCEVGAGSACHKWQGGGRAGRGERPRWQVTDPDA